DIDPKGDHRLDRLPGVGERVETIELSGSECYRGLLDPLRVGTPETREDLAYNFLSAILPPPVRPEWQTQLRLPISQGAARPAASCAEVASQLAASENPDAIEVGHAIEVHGRAGLAGLGFGGEGEPPPTVGDAQVVSLRIRNLSLPLAGTPRTELA